MPGFVKGDATALPFEDGSFDYVTSVDVYEHIAPESREKFLSELRRTARGGVLLAAPFDSAVVRDAERIASEFHRAIHLQGNVWLEEHAENGLPGLEEAREFFEGHEDTVSVLPNGYIPHWLTMICFTFYVPKLKGELGEFFERVNAFYNEFSYRQDNVEPCYRHLLVSLKGLGDVDLDDVASPAPESAGPSQSFTLFSTLSTMLPLAAETKRLRGALVRKEAQAKHLSSKLAQQIGANIVYRQDADSEQYVASLRRGYNQRTGKLQHDFNQVQHDFNQVKRQGDSLQQQLTTIANSRAWRLLTVLHKLRLGLGRILRSG